MAVRRANRAIGTGIQQRSTASAGCRTPFRGDTGPRADNVEAVRGHPPIIRGEDLPAVVTEHDDAGTMIYLPTVRHRWPEGLDRAGLPTTPQERPPTASQQVRGRSSQVWRIQHSNLGRFRDGLQMAADLGGLMRPDLRFRAATGEATLAPSSASSIDSGAAPRSRPLGRLYGRPEPRHRCRLRGYGRVGTLRLCHGGILARVVNAATAAFVMKAAQSSAPPKDRRRPYAPNIRIRRGQRCRAERYAPLTLAAPTWAGSTGVRRSPVRRSLIPSVLRSRCVLTLGDGASRACSGED